MKSMSAHHLWRKRQSEKAQVLRKQYQLRFSLAVKLKEEPYQVAGFKSAEHVYRKTNLAAVKLHQTMIKYPPHREHGQKLHRVRVDTPLLTYLVWQLWKGASPSSEVESGLLWKKAWDPFEHEDTIYPVYEEVRYIMTIKLQLLEEKAKAILLRGI
ncbi:RWD domain-containing protein 4 isoform X2 [Prinia subflava]|uniref:RWD domain-containing protein 4 isoform X2 n=1 Tax=Prinia subflava TaxID=208062 RepID=UPI002FDF1AB4